MSNVKYKFGYEIDLEIGREHNRKKWLIIK